jgi:hypothetical protein
MDKMAGPPRGVNASERPRMCSGFELVIEGTLRSGLIGLERIVVGVLRLNLC